MCLLVLRSHEINVLVGVAEATVCLPFVILCHPLFEDKAVRVPFSWEQGLGACQTQNLVVPWLSPFQNHHYPV